MCEHDTMVLYMLLICTADISHSNSLLDYVIDVIVYVASLVEREMDPCLKLFVGIWSGSSTLQSNSKLF